MDIQLVIPMAGLGTRFSRAGYTTPKPYLPIGKYSMIEVVVNNLMDRKVSKLVLIANQEASRNSKLKEVFRFHEVDLSIVELDHTTDGPATTCILAKEEVDPEKGLVIANSDQYLDTDMSQQYAQWEKAEVDGVIWGMEDSDPKWSYVSMIEEGFANEVREKKVISNIATCGVYGFTRASDFFLAYDMMKEANDRTNGELYVAPSYNYLIQQNRRIQVNNLGTTSQIMHGLGIPEDYENFLKNPIASQFL